MRQKIRPLLLMKRRNALFQRISGTQLAKSNQLMDETLFGAPRPVRGWSDGIDCAQVTGWPVVRFSKPVFSTNGATGVTITSGANTFNISNGDAGLGTTDLIYSGSWAPSDPVANDIITYSYDADVGDYNDGEAPPDTAFTSSFTITLENCLNVAPTQDGQTLPNVSQAEQTLISPDIDGSLGFDAGNGLNPIYSMSGAPQGAEINETTGLITGTLTQDIGSDQVYNTVVTLSSSSGSASAPAFQWTVTADQPATEDGWATEDGFNWLTETGDRWLLETSAQAVTHNGQPVTHNGEEVTHG